METSMFLLTILMAQWVFRSFLLNYELNEEYIQLGLNIGVIDKKLQNDHYIFEGKTYHELHYGIMIQDNSMTNGWKSIDPSFGNCGNSTVNPLNWSVWEGEPPIPPFN